MLLSSSLTKEFPKLKNNRFIKPLPSTRKALLNYPKSSIISQNLSTVDLELQATASQTMQLRDMLCSMKR
jgi:hypothetical protein